MIDSVAFERLRRIGLSQSGLQAYSTLMEQHPGSVPLRVTEVQRESVALHDGENDLSGRLLPALRTQLAEEGDALAVGDWVLAERNPFGQWWVLARAAPLNQLARRLHDGRDKVARVVIVSNVDTALLVMGLDHDFNTRRLERYLALVRMAGVAAVVVLTKRDLCADAPARLQQVQAMLSPDTVAVAVDACSVRGSHEDKDRRADDMGLQPHHRPGGGGARGECARRQRDRLPALAADQRGSVGQRRHPARDRPAAARVAVDGNRPARLHADRPRRVPRTVQGAGEGLLGDHRGDRPCGS